MTLRYQSGITNISHALTTIAHGLIGTPDEYLVALHSPTMPYFAGISSTNVVLAAGGGGASANVQVAVTHTKIR